MSPFPLPIPFSEKLAYAKYHFGNKQDRDEAISHFGELDRTWLAEWHRRHGKK